MAITDTKKNILLGQSVEQQVKNTDDNFTSLFDTVDDLDSAIKTVANQRVKSVTYDTIADMVTALQALEKTELKVGDNIYIKATDVPDFWISAVNTTQNTSNNAATLAANGYVNTQIGYFTLEKLETEKVNLSNHVTTDSSALVADEIIVGNGNKKVKNSSKKITTTLGSDDTTVPTSKAVKTVTDKKVDKVDGKGLSTNDYTTAEKNKLAGIVDGANKTIVDSSMSSISMNPVQNKVVNAELGKKVDKVDGKGLSTNDYTTAEKNKLAAIDSSLQGVTADEIGKVKDVKVNGSSVLGTDGVAAITVADLAAGFVAVTTTDSVWTTKAVNGTTYQAIKVEKTDTSLGVFNANKEEMVVQKAYDDNYLYLCVGTAKVACTIRKLSGGAVGGGSGGSGGASGKYQHDVTIYWSKLANYNGGYGSIHFLLNNDVSAAYQNTGLLMNDVGSSRTIPASGTIHVPHVSGDDQNDDQEEMTIWITGVSYTDAYGINASNGSVVTVALNDAYYKNVSWNRCPKDEIVTAL